MFNNLFPLGTVVKLKGEPELVMIIGRLIESTEEEVYEYAGCPFPAGIMSDEHLLFDGEDVEAVHFIGFQDDLELTYRTSLSAAVDQYIKSEEE